ncbi:hypothetical protein DFJ63DRAFT_313153 [Scheffersomyces coipomensis]|uniref:uncharacterized protein n=1 Tax=Scheffersomyces coipomensis TaxID=1788519 RepID=UPI00315CF5B5
MTTKMLSRDSHPHPHSQYQSEDVNLVNSFWGPDFNGYNVVCDKLDHSIQTMEEILHYYQERINIEQDYCKKLDKLNSKISIGSKEIGSLKVGLEKFKIENQQMIQYNHKFIKSVNVLNYDTLNQFFKTYVKRINKIKTHINKLISKLTSSHKHLNHSKQLYFETCSSLKSLKLSVKTTWGKEGEKNQANLMKLQSNISKIEHEYQSSITNYNELLSIFNHDWSLALNDIYKLEIERIQLCKVNCFNFCNNVATLCVDNDQSVDSVRSVLAKVQPQVDLQDFTKYYGTGNKMVKHYKFIDFLNGYDESSVNEVEFQSAQFIDPDFEPILSRNYSTYSQASEAVNGSQSSSNHKINQNHIFNSSPLKYKPVPKLPPSTPSPQKSQSIPIHTNSHRSNSIYSSSPEDTKADVFSIHKTKNSITSNGYTNSNYSNPTNYSSGNTNTNQVNIATSTTGSNYSTENRNWSSPRRKEKQLNQFQEQINKMSQDRSPSKNSKSNSNNTTNTQKVPIMKDFSIDFIAKALEDLNSGGNGDVNQYRRSVRLAKEHEDKYVNQRQSKTEPNTPFKQPTSDFIDDHNEIATRYNSINFNSPSKTTTNTKVLHQRPKSMLIDESHKSLSSSHHRRSLSKLPSTSYNDLYSMINNNENNNNTTPITKSPFITKAKAKYSYKPQQEGELLFKKNWNMYILHKQEDNWFICELGNNCGDNIGMVGLVPGNYLQEGSNIF